MSGDLRVLNRQRTKPIDSRRLREITRELLVELLKLDSFDLTVQLVNAHAMARLNEKHLQHEGSTDVITLDYSGGNDAASPVGELFVCVDEALAQAKRFDTTWQAEVVRYIVHGTLHLCGHDDLRQPARRRMKSEENRLVRELGRRFRLNVLGRRTKVTP